MSDTAVQELTRLTQADAQPAMRLAAFRALGGLHYSRDEHQQALAAFEAGLEIQPEDGELLNNVAYILSERMDDPQRARVYAEQAARIRPSDANVLDTLGATYLRLGELDKALDTLNQAVTVSGQNSPPVAAYIHLVELHLKRGEAGEARRYLDLLGELERTTPEAVAPHADDLQALRDRVSTG